MADQPRGKTSRTALIIFAVVYAGLAIVRLINTLPRHIIDHDEGHSLLNADTWHRIFRWVLSGGLWSGRDSLAALRDSFHREGGTLYTAGKFGYSLLLALVALPGHVTASEGLALAWFCGLLLPIIAGVITWQYTRALQPALITAAACITSALLMGLSREVSGTIWALTLTLAGLALLQQGIIRHRPWRFGLPGGALIAFGFSCHFNSAPLILGSFVAAFLFARMQLASVPDSLRRIAPAALTAFICVALLEAATQIVDYRLRVLFPEYRSLFGDLWKMLTQDQVYMMQGIQYGDGELGWGRAAWGYWFDIFLHREPLFACCAIMALAAFAFATPRRRLLPPMVLWLIPFAFYALHPAKVERVLGMVIATGWIAIAVSLWQALLAITKSRVPFFVPLLLLQSLCWRPVSQPISPIPDAVNQALTYVQQHGGTITAGAFDKTFAPVWKWTILEQARRPQFADVWSHIDFSTLQPGDIAFQVYRLPADADRLARTLTEEETTSATVILSQASSCPHWLLRVIRVQ